MRDLKHFFTYKTRRLLGVSLYDIQPPNRIHAFKIKVGTTRSASQTLSTALIIILRYNVHNRTRRNKRRFYSRVYHNIINEQRRIIKNDCPAQTRSYARNTRNIMFFFFLILYTRHYREYNISYYLYQNMVYF